MERWGNPRLLWWDLEGVRRRSPQAEDGVVRLVRGLPLSRAILRGFGLLLAEAHDLREEGVRTALQDVLHSPARPPSALLTSSEPGNVRFLKEFLVEEVAWTSEPEAEVLARVLRLATIPDRKRLALLLLERCSGCATLEATVRNLFLRPRPPFRVQDLTRTCFVSASTLARRWREGHSRSMGPSLKGLVDWALLLTAREMSQAGLSLYSIQGELGVHRSTLERAARRVARTTFREFLHLPRDGLWVLLDRDFAGAFGKMTGIA